MGQKSTDAEIRQRINAVYKMLVKSISRAVILEYAAAQWKASERTADEYIARARGLIAEYTSTDEKEALTLELDRLDAMLVSLYPMLHPQTGAPDLKAIDRALRISDQRCKLLGLYAPTRADLTVQTPPLKAYIGFSPDMWDEDDNAAQDAPKDT